MSSVERNNPPPRRKSCDACRAAKRRCDLALPACFRCTRRDIACVYPGLPAEQIPELLALLNGHDNVGGTNACAEEFMFDAMPTPPMLDLGLETPSQPLPLPSAFEDQSRLYTVPVPVYTGNGEMVHVRSEMTFSLSELMASRFQYAIDILKDTPRKMVTENQTPWSHAQLYSNGMPKAMQDAYACCALYIAKNPINAPMITSHIHSRHQELTLSPLPSSPPDLLAHTHALLLYTIMSLFDADLHALNTSVHLDTLTMSALQSSASLLFSSTHFPPSPSPSPSPDGTATNSAIVPPAGTAPSFWPLWTVEESARRTILFTFYVLQILRLFRGDQDMKCDGKLGLLHSWYASAYLWNAPSAVEFGVAWEGREHFVVRNVDFGDLLRDAQPADVDVLGRMLLVTSLGVERVRGWFGGRGAVL
ncbi:Zn(II)2Cys6 transcription factor domain-containing protein [Aspergillus mulundensis]|uniref:Zn(2)-C6 fungal-type domain-containing protein n=1 Tax=Aspergillus mulundensis TaxID=1810919 RepID=A0A3D8S4R5_9EURO|nr:Uncharacterized protein DSM5745_04826 [Aspergillus mulundensis]RDW81269.1 Uncharacterized protein DSM5745_04826 [Aspergillus mulundensis]